MRSLISRAALVFSITAVSSLNAGTLSTAGQDLGTSVDVLGITGFTTLGSDMSGLTVTASFLGGGSSSCNWAATSATAGGCSTAFFTISVDGDTFSQPWILSTPVGANFRLSGLLFDGVGAGSGTRTNGVVFDRTFGGATGTPNTAAGFDAAGTTTGDDGSASYQDVLTILGAPTDGDVFGRVAIRFGADGITGANWVMDTDTVGVGGTATPEPSTLAMLGTALLGLGLLRRKK